MVVQNCCMLLLFSTLLLASSALGDRFDEPAPQSEKVKIALFGNFDNETAGAVTMQNAGAAFFKAVEEINADSTFMQYHNIEYKIYHTNCDGSQAYEDVLDAVNIYKANALFGPMCEASCKPIAAYAGLRMVPHFGFNCKDPDYTSPLKFPERADWGSYLVGGKGVGSSRGDLVYKSFFRINQMAFNMGRHSTDVLARFSNMTEFAVIYTNDGQYSEVYDGIKFTADNDWICAPTDRAKSGTDEPSDHDPIFKYGDTYELSRWEKQPQILFSMMLPSDMNEVDAQTKVAEAALKARYETRVTVISSPPDVVNAFLVAAYDAGLYLYEDVADMQQKDNTKNVTDFNPYSFVVIMPDDDPVMQNLSWALPSNTVVAEKLEKMLRHCLFITSNDWKSSQRYESFKADVLERPVDEEIGFKDDYVAPEAAFLYDSVYYFFTYIDIRIKGYHTDDNVFDYLYSFYGHADGDQLISYELKPWPEFEKHGRAWRSSSGIHGWRNGVFDGITGAVKTHICGDRISEMHLSRYNKTANAFQMLVEFSGKYAIPYSAKEFGTNSQPRGEGQIGDVNRNCPGIDVNALQNTYPSDCGFDENNDWDLKFFGYEMGSLADFNNWWSDDWSGTHPFKSDLWGYGMLLSEENEPIVRPMSRGDCLNNGIYFYDERICDVEGGVNPAFYSLFAILVPLLLGVFGYYGWVQYKVKKDIEAMRWRLSWQDINFSQDAKQKSTMMSTMKSALSKFTDATKRTFGGKTGGENAKVLDENVAVVNGARAYVSHITEKPASTWSYTDLSVKQTLTERTNMNHINVLPFVGATVEEPHFALVHTYMPKGCLDDILQDPDIKLDKMFKVSMMLDLISGLKYIHNNTSMKFHGKLRSTNTYIDNRWNLKLSSFGLQSFESCTSLIAEECESDYQYWRKQLWVAPEHLVAYVPGQGSQEGDVFSLGVLFHEIIFRQGPYGTLTDELTPKEIVAKVLSENTRPDCEKCKSKQFAQVMQSCWSKTPSARATLPDIHVKVLAVNRGKAPNIMDNMVNMLEKYTNNLEGIVSDRTAALVKEGKKVETLLCQMLPAPVAAKLKEGKRVEAEQFDSVTIYFSDIVGFTALSAKSTPIQVVNLLNDLYTEFDSCVEQHDVYKVETIGDAYMVVSGMPNRNGNKHAGEIASLCLDLLSSILVFRIRHAPEDRLKLRIGMHTGSAVAGVVGLKMPRYCLFGDTVSKASQMESGGLALRIHMSEESVEILRQLGGFYIEERMGSIVCGSQTYWLNGKDGYTRRLPTAAELPQ